MVKIIRGLFGNLHRTLVKTFIITKDANNRFKQTFVTITNVIMTLVCISSMYFLGLEKSLEGTASFSAYAFIISAKHVIYYFRQDEIKQALEIFAQIQKEYKEKWEKELFKRASDDTWNMVYKFCLIVVSYQIFYLISTISIDFIIGNIFTDFPSIRVHLPCDGYIEFFEPRTFQRFLVTIPVLMWTAEAITIHLGSETLVFVLMMYTKLELQMIKYRLTVIKNHLEQKDNLHLVSTEKLLSEVIQRHQRTLKVLDIIKDTLGLPLAIHYTSVSLTLSVIFYCIMTFLPTAAAGNMMKVLRFLNQIFAISNVIIQDERGSLTAKFNGVTAIICIGSLLFAMCFFGESLEEENDEINKNIYELPWYNENMQVRKTVIIMLKQTQRPFVINYHLTAELSLKTLMQVINTAYSFLMVLKSTVH